MRLNRRQLRRLIESAIYEQSEGGKKQVVPKEVRAELTKLRTEGQTALAFDGDGNRGIAIGFTKKSVKKGAPKLALGRLKKIYGDDRVVMGGVKRLQGGSASIKAFGPGVGANVSYGSEDDVKDRFQKYFTGDDAIFIKMD